MFTLLMLNLKTHTVEILLLLILKFQNSSSKQTLIVTTLNQLLYGVLGFWGFGVLSPEKGPQ